MNRNLRRKRNSKWKRKNVFVSCGIGIEKGKWREMKWMRGRWNESGSGFDVPFLGGGKRKGRRIG
jgi:hypothetical protein